MPIRSLIFKLIGVLILALAVWSIWVILTLTGASSKKPGIVDLDPTEYGSIGAFADDLLSPAAGAAPYVGASVAIIREGEVRHLAGYGSKQADQSLPVDPTATPFRLGSVTKWFTATAVAQLVDQGLVDLDQPANTYLKRFELPARFGVDTTVADLLAHRTGLESFDVHTFTERTYDLPVDGDEIRSFLPRQIKRPGAESVYSNFGVSTLGAIVEDVSGLTFNEFVRTRILDPLEMTNSGLDHEFGPGAPDALPKPAILRQDGSWETIPYFAKHPYFIPSGGIYATAEDMTKFMRAHLERGETEFSRRLMSSQGYDRMYEVLGGNADVPNVPKFGFIVWLDDYNGARTMSHSGNVQTFRAFMLLIPDEKLGVFVSEVGDVPYYDRKDAFWKAKNETGVGNALLPFRAAYELASFYIGERTFEATSGLGQKIDLSRYEGEYWNRQRQHSTFLRLFGFEGGASVHIADDATLTIRGRRGFVPVAEHTFMTPDGRRSAVFKIENNQVVSFVDDYPSVWDRVEGIQTPEFRQTAPILLGFLLAITGSLMLFFRSGSKLSPIIGTLAGSGGLLVMGTLLWVLLVLEIQSQRILLEASATIMAWGVIGHLAWIMSAAAAIGSAVAIRQSISSDGGHVRLFSAAGYFALIVLAIATAISIVSLGFFGLSVPGRF